MKRWVLAGAAVTGVVVVTPVLMMAAGAGSQTSITNTACTTGQVMTVKSPNLDAVQAKHAGEIIGTGAGMNIPTKGLIIAIAVAYQESKLRVLANSTVPESLTIPHDGVGSDHDSVGLFQQRASWGSVTERMDPATSAVLFYRALAKVPGWQSMSVTLAAQTVQGSATPTAYAQWETLATSVVSSATGGAPVGTCADVLTSSVSGAAGVAINHALAIVAMHSAYSFGGDCSDPSSTDMSKHCDCSSFVMTSWGAAGVRLPRTSEEQYTYLQARGRVVAGITAANVAQLAQPGMLLFYELSSSGPGHVALAIGNGMLAEAPQPGEDVHMIHIYSSTFVAAATVG